MAIRPYATANVRGDAINRVFTSEPYFHDYRIGRMTGCNNRVTPDGSLYIDHYSLKIIRCGVTRGCIPAGCRQTAATIFESLKYVKMRIIYNRQNTLYIFSKTKSTKTIPLPDQGGSNLKICGISLPSVSSAISIYRPHPRSDAWYIPASSIRAGRRIRVVRLPDTS